MALTLGTETSGKTVPGGTTLTISHNQTVGTDGGVSVSIICINSNSVTGVTYGGTAMTKIHDLVDTGVSQYYSSWYLDSPSTGSNNMVATFSTALWDNCVYNIQSYTGCDGIGNTDTNTSSTGSQTGSISVSANSRVMCGGGRSNGDMTHIKVDGVTYTTYNVNETVNTNGWACKISNAISAGGSKATDVKISVTWANINNVSFEIKEAASTPATNTQSIVIS